nr:HEAT repeat domain-containing protein [Xenococcaceae cyanobacterium MO_167.B52]
DQYVFRGGHPDYKVAYSWDNDSKLAKLTVTQTQAKDNKTGSDSELFDLKIPIAFGYIDNAPQSYTLRIYQQEQTFYFPLEKKPDFISFDVNNYILKTVKLEYPVTELKNQLKYDTDPVSRIYATKALGKKGGLEVVKALSTALLEDTFWGVKVEVAKTLGKIKLNQAEAALIKGLQDKNAKVRCAVIEALSNFKTVSSYETIKELLDKGDASYYVEASCARCLGGMVSGNLKDKQEDTITLLQDILNTRAGWNETVRSGAIGGLSKMTTSAQAVDIIIQYTQPGTPQALRLAAIRSLGAVSSGQTPETIETILEQLDSLSGESFFLTQVAVTTALGQMQTPKAIGILQNLSAQTPDGRVKRRADEAISKVEKNIGSDKAVKELREELDKLKKDNQDLKSRLESLEAKSK